MKSERCKKSKKRFCYLVSLTSSPLDLDAALTSFLGYLGTLLKIRDPVTH